MQCKTHIYFNLYEKQCLKATLGASAKAQTNRHLSAGGYKNGGGADKSSNNNFTNNGKKPVVGKGSQPQSAQTDKAT